MTRIEAAAEALEERSENDDWEWCLGDAQAALAAADAHDAAHGIHRVSLDEETVERAARAMFAEEQCDRRQKLDVESNWIGRLNDRDRDEYRRLTRAVLAAAVEAGEK